MCWARLGSEAFREASEVSNSRVTWSDPSFGTTVLEAVGAPCGGEAEIQVEALLRPSEGLAGAVDIPV